MNNKETPTAKVFIEKIKEFDKYCLDLAKELDPMRKVPLVVGSSRIKWTTIDHGYIYKAMSLDALSRLQASKDLLKLFNFSCFEDFEIIFQGSLIAIIRQRKLNRVELLDNADLMLPILQKEIQEKYPNISFYPFKNLSPYQKRFYLDYPEEFYKLMTFIKTFEIKDAIEFSNCGIDPDTGKIKCFDLELQGRHSISKIETLINTFVEDKNFSFPSFSIFISG